MSDEIIDNLTVFEFELTESLSLFYDRTEEIWYVEKFNTIEEENIFIVEDEDFSLEDEVEVFGYVLTKDMLDEYKEILKEDIENE